MLLHPTAVAAGGDAIARDEAGRVVFVDGALPGETVDAVLDEEKGDFARASVAHVVEAAPERVEPPCPMVAAGCGGCGWQHVSPPGQAELKRAIVLDALRRIAHLPDAPVADAVRAVGPQAYRTTVRLAVDPETGRAGYRRRRSHEVVVPEVGCMVVHPLLDDLIATGSYRGVDEVTLRVSAATGERMALLHGSGGRDAYAMGAELPDDVAVVDGSTHGARAQRKARQAAVTEEVLGRRYRVSPTAFFQSGPEAATLLATAVREAVGPPPELLLDAYCGVGILAGAVAGPRTRVVGVESHAAAASDARHNFASFGIDADVITGEVARIPPPGKDEDGPGVVIADPARPGLGKGAASALAWLRAERFVLVSCDPASLARDVNLLSGHGYRLTAVEVLDLFPHTPHVEAVATFER